MISHEHKCIFIHISKCAGTSIEKAFGLKTRELNYDILYGWCPKNRLYLQHATPQQLLDLGYIDREIWDSYYKFVIVRNPWDRAYSDYLWSINNEDIYDSFSNFIQGKGKFTASFSTDKDFNIADHLYTQYDYFFLNGKEIKYDKIIRFEDIKNGLSELATVLSMAPDAFKKRENVNKKRFRHYSVFYTGARKRWVDTLYAADIELLDYSFEDKRKFGDGIITWNLVLFHPNASKYFLLKYPKLGRFLLAIKKIFG
ncbi:MAG: sulfotransferase family 2 domain-containing protein [Bacteroidota bacterium]